jgi:hypothetical protein
MTEFNDSQEFLAQTGEKPKLPGAINVLTILTFVGCGVGIIWTLLGFWFVKFAMKMADSPEAQQRMTEKQLTEMEQNRPKLQLMLDNMWPLILIGVVGIALCLYGAIQMRKLKKEGFYIYVVGQILPFIATGLLIGFGTQFSGVASYLFACIPVLFIILYAAQLKYLK